MDKATEKKNKHNLCKNNCLMKNFDPKQSTPFAGFQHANPNYLMSLHVFFMVIESIMQLNSTFYQLGFALLKPLLTAAIEI